MTEYLQHVKADVVFAFFGHNESFDGTDKADDQRRKLIAFVQERVQSPCPRAPG